MAADQGKRLDSLLALAFGIAGEIEGLIHAGGHVGLLTVGSLAGPALGVPMLFRRARPLLSMVVLVGWGIASTLVENLLAPHGWVAPNAYSPIFAILVASYSLGAFGRVRDLALGLPQPLILIVIVDLMQPGANSIPSALAFFAVFLVAAPAIAGRLVRARALMVATLHDQRRQLDAERDVETRTAVAVERLHLAEQLHDDLVVGMDTLAADVAAAVVVGGDRQASAVAHVEATARSLLAETRRVVVSLAADPPVADATIRDDPNGSAGITSRAVQPTPVDSAHGPATTNAAVPWAALAAAAMCIGLLIEVRDSGHLGVPMPIALLCCFVLAAPVAFTWSRPLLMTTAVWTAAALFSAFVLPLGSLFAAIGLSFVPPFMVGIFCGRRRALVGLAICGIGQLAALGWGSLPDFVSTASFVICAWFAGRVLHARSRLVEELRANNALLVAQREAILRQHVAEERARIARDLHDSIGHHLTIIALQAGAARRMWTADPVKAAEALATIGPVAARGRAELRSGLGTGTELITPDPAPTLDLDALLDNARAAGLSVTMHTDGEQPDLGDDTRLAVFRVLQEALTNVLRHAPGSVADVTMHGCGSYVELTVSNSPSHRRSDWSAAGTHGQRGMRERVTEHGGQIDYGRRDDGGFEVRARFPVPAVTA